VIAFLFGTLNFTPITLLPTLLQNLRGYPDSVIGYVLAWRGVGTLLGFFTMFFAGRLDPRIPIFVGFSLQAVAGYAMAQFDLNISMFDVAWTTAVQGYGVGVVWVSLSVVTFSTLDPKFVPDGTAVFHLLRNIGSSVHISLSVALVLHSRAINYADMVPAVSEYNKSFELPWVTGGWSLDSTSGLAALSREITRQAGMIGYINAFYFFTLTALVALPFILLIRRRKKPM
jgi:DHA2 family multidrug resistance protein